MTASNYEDVVQQIQAYGLFPELPLQIDTPKSIRCRVDGGGKEKRGWYWLNEILIDGNLVIVGSYGCFRGNDSNAQKVKLGKLTRMSAEQAVALKRQLTEAAKKAEHERKRQITHASRRASAMWARLDSAGESPYLLSKRVQGYGLRYTPSGTAVLPLVDSHGQLFGLQFLRTASQAEQAKRHTKEFWPAGLAKQGNFHVIGPAPAGDQVVVIVEGYATGASIHEATGHTVVVAFDAGNIDPVCNALRKVWRTARMLICADDDSMGTCRDKDCKQRIVLAQHPTDCPACGKPHQWVNTGESAARTSVLGQGSERAAFLLPAFADDAARITRFLETGRKLTDFNDLAVAETTVAVAAQVNACLRSHGWLQNAATSPSSSPGGGATGKLTVLHRTDDLLSRFAYIYGSKGGVFDRQEHMIVANDDVKNLCIRSDVHKSWMEHPDRQIVRLEEVGFDPTGNDRSVTCNLWAGWPTEPVAGDCQLILDHLFFLCSAEQNAREVYEWILDWVALPLQRPGAKMKSTIVLHGGQGTGKNVFFEAVLDIYKNGVYGLILDQNALADKHNDWASRKLFLIADEVVASSDRYDLKNQLKGLITGKTLRINPKHMAARSETNHANIVFLSNERMPVVLEDDDRRHCVIRTPRAKDEAYYIALAHEIDNGGIAALHHALLKRDLREFNEHTKPPYTESKGRLIELGKDSPISFLDALIENDLAPLSVKMPGLTMDWYKAYQHWCHLVGGKPASLKHFVSVLEDRRQLRTTRKGYLVGQSVTSPKSVLLFGWRAPEGATESHALGDEIEKMKNALGDYRNLGSVTGSSSGWRNAA